MCGICCKQESAYSHRLGKPLVYFIRTEVDDSVLVLVRVTRQHDLELFWLPLDQLFVRETVFLSVSDTPQTVFADSCCHEPMLGMYNKV